jgi:hypothetical protein
VANISDLFAAMRKDPRSVRFADACKVADHYFGKPRHHGTSHRVWKMPWAGNPRVNMQDDDGKAKRYQVDQLVAAIDNLEVQLAKKSQEAQAKVDAEAESKSGRKKKGRIS